MKICKYCKIEKDESEYYRYSDGYLRGGCKVCLRKEDKKRRNGEPLTKIEHVPWNKGKTNIYNEDTLKKMGSGWRGKKVPKELVEKRRNAQRKGKARNSFQSKAWIKAVKDKDRWACKHCGCADKGKLHAHHIVPWNESENLRFDINNGLTLCNSCHNKEEAKTNKKRKKAWNKGKKLSEAHRKKLSESHKGVKPKTAWKKGQPAWNKGIPMGEESKKKLSSKNKGRNKNKTWIIDPETKKRKWVEKTQGD